MPAVAQAAERNVDPPAGATQRGSGRRRGQGSRCEGRGPRARQAVRPRACRGPCSDGSCPGLGAGGRVPRVEFRGEHVVERAPVELAGKVGESWSDLDGHVRWRGADAGVGGGVDVGSGVDSRPTNVRCGDRHDPSRAERGRVHRAPESRPQRHRLAHPPGGVGTMSPDAVGWLTLSSWRGTMTRNAARGQSTCHSGLGRATRRPSIRCDVGVHAQDFALHPEAESGIHDLHL